MTKSTGKIIKLNKIGSTTKPSAKVTDVKNQRQREEKNIIKIKKSSGDVKTRTSQKAGEGKIEKSQVKKAPAGYCYVCTLLVLLYILC